MDAVKEHGNPAADVLSTRRRKRNVWATYNLEIDSDDALSEDEPDDIVMEPRTTEEEIRHYQRKRMKRQRKQVSLESPPPPMPIPIKQWKARVKRKREEDVVENLSDCITPNIENTLWLQKRYHRMRNNAGSGTGSLKDAYTHIPPCVRKVMYEGHTDMHIGNSTKNGLWDNIT